VRAEQRNDELGGAEAVEDFLFPFLAGPDLAAILPDLVAAAFEVSAEAVGEVAGIAAAVAEEEAGAGLGHRCWGLNGRAPGVFADVADPIAAGFARVDLVGATTGTDGERGGHG
jgi:hypothetical protein